MEIEYLINKVHQLYKNLYMFIVYPKLIDLVQVVNIKENPVIMLILVLNRMLLKGLGLDLVIRSSFHNGWKKIWRRIPRLAPTLMISIKVKGKDPLLEFHISIMKRLLYPKMFLNKHIPLSSLIKVNILLFRTQTNQ